MARSIRRKATGAFPQRYRTKSERGTHAAGSSFRNAQIVQAQVATTNLTLTLDQPVALRGTPGMLTDVAGATPVSASIDPSGTIITITYSADITTATEVRLMANDPAIRTRTGGWLVAAVFPIV